MSKQRDPIQAEFFNTDSITTTADEIVRESNQNTLDAAEDDSAGVRVRIYVSGAEGALDPSVANRYFEGLWEHAEACDAEMALRDQPCRFVVIEDFGTTGLLGDESAYEEPDPGATNHFFYFFRAEGKSGKSGSDRGRWGVGKYVFPKASQINSFFAMTIRSGGLGEPGPLLMGQAVMKNHKVDGESWEPDGWWAAIDERNVPVPAQGSDVVSDFRRTWQLERHTEPGLSVVVPYVEPDLDAEQLRRSVVRDYFVAILAGTLTVEVDAPGSDRLEVSRESLDDVIDTLLDGGERHEVRQNAELVRWGLDQPQDQVVTLNAPVGSPQWDGNLIPDDARLKIGNALAAGERVVVRVPVSVKPRSGEATESFFDVMLSAEQDHRRLPLFVREGIIVSEVHTRAVPNVRAIVLAMSGPMAELLGDAEGPAHTNWSDRTERFKGKYLYGPKWLKFVKQSPYRILEIVRGDDDEADRTVAAQFFSIPSSDDGVNQSNGSGEGKKVTPPGTKPPPPGSPRPIRVAKSRKGGFTVWLTESGSGIKAVEVTAAYDRSRGNPFAKWSKVDFEMADLDVYVAGGSIVESEGNRVIAEVDVPSDFTLRVTGFDVNRDVRVKAAKRG